MFIIYFNACISYAKQTNISTLSNETYDSMYFGASTASSRRSLYSWTGILLHWTEWIQPKQLKRRVEKKKRIQCSVVIVYKLRIQEAKKNVSRPFFCVCIQCAAYWCKFINFIEAIFTLCLKNQLYALCYIVSWARFICCCSYPDRLVYPLLPI